jgi:hypothetical protein
MSTPERRKHSRVKINYPISYGCTDKKGLLTLIKTLSKSRERLLIAKRINQKNTELESALKEPMHKIFVL